MGFFNTLRSVKRWFTDKTGFTTPNESKKRKHEECKTINNKKIRRNYYRSPKPVTSEPTINNKKIRMADSLVEVFEMTEESDAEEVEVTKPGPSTMPLRASLPVMLIDGRHNQRRTISPKITTDLTENCDDENKTVVNQSYCLSNRPFISNKTMGMVRSESSKSCLSNKYSPTSSIKGSRKSNLCMEGSFSSLKISNTSINDRDNVLAKILNYYISPKPVTSEPTTTTPSTTTPSTTTSSTTSSITIESTSTTSSSVSTSSNDHTEQMLIQSNSSETSEKENMIFPELSKYKNRIMNHEMFYDRILRKFREKQAAASLVSTTIKQKSPEDIFIEKLELMKKELDKIEPPKKQEIFPDYCEEVVVNITYQLSGPNEIIVLGKNIRKDDLMTVFSPSGWLNDEVINHYLSMIVDRDPNSIHTFDTFFYNKLSSQGYQSVRRWSRKKDIFTCKKMFSPIHLGNHWCLTCVNFIDKTIKYYDSLGGQNPTCLDTILYYLKEEYKNKKNEEFDCSGWRLMMAEDCPRQENGFDCGVFTCVNAEYLARDAELDFTQDDMPILRHRLCHEILNNKLCY